LTPNDRLYQEVEQRGQPQGSPTHNHKYQHLSSSFIWIYCLKLNVKATAKPRMWIRVHRYNKKHHCWNWQFQFVLEEDLTTKMQTGKQIPE